MPTGFAHPKCFARNLLDCSARLSKEHFISTGLMTLIGADKFTTLSGPAWLQGSQEIRVSTASLGSHVLCERHNNHLSHLDQEMVAFLTHLTGANGKTGTLQVDGFALEKWFLKAQQGYLASGYAHKQLKGWEASAPALDMLFRDRHLFGGSGFYFLSGSHEAESNAIALLPLRGPKPHSMAGIALLISGFPFLFLLVPPWPQMIRDLSPFTLRYRPEVINVRHGSFECEVHTGWHTGEIVEIDISSPIR